MRRKRKKVAATWVRGRKENHVFIFEIVRFDIKKENVKKNCQKSPDKY